MRFLAIALALGVSATALLLPFFSRVEYISSRDIVRAKFEAPKKVEHLSTPEPLKAIYMTACVAATPSWREKLKGLIDTTELNAVVIDIKDYTGEVAFSQDSQCFVGDLGEFVQKLHDASIYVIGRISVFQDPYYAKRHPELAVQSVSGGIWRDHKGLSFIDVGAKPYWDYIVDISNEAYALGFDELNFDYVRYPSDGDMEDVRYVWTGMSASSTNQLLVKSEILESFFSYLGAELEKTGVKTSVDLFGMTTSATNDLGIGQLLEKALPYFDFVSPMVYPSHYPKGWHGFSNPAEYPYEVIKIAMEEGRAREIAFNNSTSTASKLRPWLQDFHLGATYDAEKVRAQIKATYDVGLTSWMLWSASNKYTKEALLND